MADIKAILSYSLVGNTLGEYLVALVVFLGIVAALHIFKSVIIHYLRSLAQKTKTDLDDMVIEAIDHIEWPFYFFLGLTAGVHFLNTFEWIHKGSYYVAIIVITFYAIKMLQHIISYSAKKIQDTQEDKTNASIISLMSTIVKIFLWVTAFLLILSNLGYDVTSLMAGLGIGGIAVALALQNILGDLFASLSIYFDKPFKVGDFIIIGEHVGTVKKVGIKTTRIQSLWGEEIVVSNAEMTSTRVRNFGKLKRRRIQFTFGVTYDTPTIKLKKIPEYVKNIFDKIDIVDLDRVHWKEYGDFSLNYEVIYYVNDSEYTKYMDVQQEVNMALKEKFEAERIEFAYPTQTILLNKESEKN
jgi:small-conductance mechanosensitive channel